MDKSLGSRDTTPPDDPSGSDGIKSVGDWQTLRAMAGRKRFKAGEMILGRYKVTGELGQGGMGVVYRCFDEVGGIDVALKALPPELSHDSSEMAEVRENFQLVSRLVHTNIAQIRTLDKDPATGDYYLVMECVDGINLRDYRKKHGGKLTLEQVMRIAPQVAGALDYAHGQKIIHRDIKPANVMIRADGTVKVLDFGLAAQLHTSMSRVSKAHYGTSGTGPYMAPEQWEGDYQDAATDQYAFGALVYELLAGRCPFESHDSGVLRHAVLHGKAKPIDGVPAREMDAILRALAKTREDRFADCAEFVEALGGGKIEPRRTRSNAEGKRSGVRGLRLGVGVVLLVALGYGSLVSLKSLSARRAEERTAQDAAAKQNDASKQQIAQLQQAVEQALTSGNLKAAGESLSDLEELGVQIPAVRDLRARYEAAAGAQEVRKRQAEASLEYEAAQKLEPGQGLEKKLKELELVWREAEQAKKDEAWGPALTSYDHLLGKCRELGEWDAARKGAKAQGRKAEGARQSASGRNAERDALALWNGAASAASAAATAYEAGDFAGASKGWKDAEVKFQSSEQRAVAVQAYGKAKADYDAAASRADRELLGQYAAGKWKEAQQQARTAEQSGDTPDEGRRAYEAALAALDAAVKEAEEKSIPILKVTAKADGADVKATVSDGKSTWMTPVELKLAKNQSYTFQVTYAGGGKRWKAVRDTRTSDWVGVKQWAVALEASRGPEPGRPWTVPELGMEFVPVEAGSFQMGSEDGHNDEKPVHGVRITKPFWMGKYEVTQEEYRKISGQAPSYFKGDRLPVETVNWNEAVAFCRKLTEQEQAAGRLPEGYEYRLPTEAEWEYAARGGTLSRGTGYAGGDDIDRVAWYTSNSGSTTHEAGTKAANELGLYDMSGNVWEWCLDAYQDSYTGAPADGSERTGSGAVSRVLRGGSWPDDATYCRVAYRRRNDPTDSYYCIGFRVVLGAVR
ncbi:MAG: SUMF1/EgtB/PvdO family nonheme iron enzyme [bacterium]